MLRTDLTADLRSDELAPGFVRPAWTDYTFANVPDTVRSLFDAPARRPLPPDVFEGVDTDVDHVVCVLVDGFGWNHFLRERDNHPFLQTLSERATVTPLTSLFPAETAAAVSTFNTATQPCEHGVLGWNAYVEELGGYVQTLPFVDREGTPLGEVRDDPDIATLIDERPMYEDLPNAVVVAPEGQGESAYSKATTTGARSVDYRNVAQAGYRVRRELAAADGPTYVYCYFPQVDALSHYEGVASPETDAQLGSVCAAIEREIVDRLDSAVAERTLLLVTADHGEVDATPETRIDLGELDLDPHLRRGTDGEPIPAVGGPRNLQFYARDGHREAIVAALESGLSMLDPLVLTREEVLDVELFGDREPSQRFLDRCPDVLVIPDEGFVWYDRGQLSYVGMHGGLHPDEMLVPFAAARVDALQG
ncbi:alkaline phosphatase family protein [Halorarius litoreus]|uniref:alkaline phosphatase family protein n=1 Tax=Halorarius litoreus TaxID=2962676 RepID=UPI0020CBCE72|nr:alkaline phosphatase family protein [Halorarius litoreus]